MSRYVERAEHVARLLLVNSETLIDVGDIDHALLNRHWLSVLQIMHLDSQPPAGDKPFPQRVAAYMTFDETNPNSLIKCLTRARENARGIREVISSEMWEHVNTLYWSIRADDAAPSFEESPGQLYQRVITGSMLFQGLTDQTLAHDQRWFFAQLGKYFERIGVTCRVLRTKYEILHNTETAHVDTPLNNIHWSAVLRSCGSIETYLRTYLAELDPEHVAQFLVLDDEFPRSVRSCVRQALLAISAIRAIVRPKSVDPTERILGRLDAQLEYADPSELMSADGGLTRYLTGILDAIAEASLAVQRSFFLH
jgi:uncharacterized alpha-E superfamily protein